MKIGEYLKSLRLSRSLTLDDISSFIGVTSSHLSRIESNKLPPSDELLEKLAPVLGVRKEELLLMAGRVPPKWVEIISQNPHEATAKMGFVIAEEVAEYNAPKILAYEPGKIKSAIENGFPFEKLAPVAELESWRKEVNRPIYHIHKWWAQRLGSVFRAILIAANSPENSDVMDLFYRRVRIRDKVIFDPFMGSGTTLGEALKLGARVIGRDINPVAYVVVKNSLSNFSRGGVIQTFNEIEKDVSSQIKAYYKTKDNLDVLYYFWVKVIECPKCKKPVDLFSSRIFSKHAYASRYPEAKAVCPKCNSINKVKYNDDHAKCDNCGGEYNPQKGNVKGQKAICSYCKAQFPIAKTFKSKGQPPAHRLYAKLVLDKKGKKEYRPIDEFDIELYKKASKELKKCDGHFPVVPIPAGYNTKQVLNYGYTFWHQMFNGRQLLCLGILANRISQIGDPKLRELFTILFSGVLEFNNMFASFKGEGTGAVRHMFSHHILKPERMPLEANLWGTPKSSGSFSTLFKSRILRAIEYKENPFELEVHNFKGRIRGIKIYHINEPIGSDNASSFDEFEKKHMQLYVSCGDSSKTDIKSGTVDLVVTDPPFFDNVHYSELADFFYIWVRNILGNESELFKSSTTRSQKEVQSAESEVFIENLSAVFKECHRVLRRDGKLIFTYHHSRQEGWEAILKAVTNAGFEISYVQPTKAEMSVAQPKRQAKEPIDLDIILICRKHESVKSNVWNDRELNRAVERGKEQIERFNNIGKTLSRNDIRIILMAQIISQISLLCDNEKAEETIKDINGKIDEIIERIYLNQKIQQNTKKISQKTLV